MINHVVPAEGGPQALSLVWLGVSAIKPSVDEGCLFLETKSSDDKATTSQVFLVKKK